jgi:cleavage and polyadenylation specificity factor subunit 1
MDAEDAGRDSTLIALGNVCGYSTVFQRGASPCFILKESSSSPKVIDLGGGAIKSLTRFHTSACQRGFAYIDAEVSHLLQFPCIELTIYRRILSI